MKRNQLLRRNSIKSFTLIELLIVVAIIGILATFVMSAMLGATVKAQVAMSRNQISSLTTALEAYNTDMGFYPRHPRSTSTSNQFADVPHLLYAGLANRATPSLGGGPNGPYMKIDNSTVGVLVGSDFFDDVSGMKILKDFNLENPGQNCRQLSSTENPASTAFQKLKPYGGGGASAASYGAALEGFPVFMDPFLNAYHYREWATKSDTYKDSTVNGAANVVAHNFNSFDIWSNGPDGINQFGHPDSDDITNWGK